MIGHVQGRNPRKRHAVGNRVAHDIAGGDAFLKVAVHDMEVSLRDVAVRVREHLQVGRG